MAISPPQPLSESEILARLRQGEVILPPLDLEWGPEAPQRDGPDTTLVIKWNGMAFRFVVEIKARGVSRVVGEAAERARGWGMQTGMCPLVVVPYLSPESLEKLERAGVSGIDLCGNALIAIPGRVLVQRSGNPNKFPESYPIRDVYRGATSLVARALLVRPWTSSLSDLESFIRARGGELTLTTISKALRRLEDDVLIDRKGGRAKVLQPEALLERLSAAYRPPKVTRVFVGSGRLDRARIGELLGRASACWAFTGQTSTDRYALMGREDVVRIYCVSVPAAVGALGSEVKETDRFANVELRETSDPTAYFDVRTEGVQAFASPIQTYLELAAGDKREQDASRQVRDRILRELAAMKDAG